MSLSFEVAAVAAVAVHELSHVLMAWVLGVKVKRVGLSWLGPYVVREHGTSAQNVAISLAGPLANFLTAAACLFLGYGVDLCLSSLVLGAFNLLPFPSSDGLRAARLLWSMGTKSSSAAVVRAA